MGVPSFYRWLVNKYPKIVLDGHGDGSATSSTRTCSMEFDNLYLDMNGIIHPCFHPEDEDEDEDNNYFPPTTYDDVFNSMYHYIDNLFNIVKPRKLLYMAIDGVAPRAKMNQQRSRRFRTAKDNHLSVETEDMLRKRFEAEGKTVLPKQESDLCDSNVITPGTEFMHLLSERLQNYITLRMATDPHWERIKVILSDSNAPGEGEHKIMSFIRAQRCGEGYDPNTRHCLYGLDADLIMLALATHEAHFYILREDVLVEERQKSGSAIEHHVEAYYAKKTVADSPKQKRAPVKKKPFQFLDVSLLREYLQVDMNIVDPPEGLNLDMERLVDDFVFMCFFSGNDFLPHMPTLEIHERAIDLLLHVYKKEFKNMGGYLVDTQRTEDKKGACMKMKRVERFILCVGEYEEEIFMKRAELRERKIKRILQDCRAEETEFAAALEGSAEATSFATTRGKQSGDIHLLSLSTQKLQLDDFVETTADSSEYNAQVLKNTIELKQNLKEYLRKQADTFRDGVLGSDKVKLGVAGWRERYYEHKFSTKGKEEVESKRKEVMQKYVEGLCWVLKYYYSGVPSWNWYYPYHYAPFASDLKGLSQVSVKFQKGFPFKPFDQLMGVLPPKSAHALPASYKGLMVDESSKIIDFYPTDFAVDVDGKRYLWQAVSKLPFIQEERLLAETKSLDKELADHERLRNAEGMDRLFLWRSSTLGNQICSMNKCNASLIKNGAISTSDLREGFNGYIHYKSGDQDSDCTDKNLNVLCMFFELPAGCCHNPRLLEGVILPEKTITAEDIVVEELWHNSSRGNRQQSHFSNRNFDRKPITKAVTPPHLIIRPAGVGWGGGRGKLVEYQQNIVPTQSLSPGNHFRVSGSTTTWASSRGPSRGMHTPPAHGYNPWQNGPRTNVSHGRGPSIGMHTPSGFGNNHWHNHPRTNVPHGRGPNMGMHTPSGHSNNPWEDGPRTNVPHGRGPNMRMHTPSGLSNNPWPNGPRTNVPHGRGANMGMHTPSGHGNNRWQNGPRTNDPHGRVLNESFVRANDAHGPVLNESFQYPPVGGRGRGRYVQREA